jgi:hypothetical protein
LQPFFFQGGVLRGATGKFLRRGRPFFYFIIGFEPKPTCCSKHAYSNSFLYSYLDASENKKQQASNFSEATFAWTLDFWGDEVRRPWTTLGWL